MALPNPIFGESEIVLNTLAFVPITLVHTHHTTRLASYAAIREGIRWVSPNAINCSVAKPSLHKINRIALYECTQFIVRLPKQPPFAFRRLEQVLQIEHASCVDHICR